MQSISLRILGSKDIQKQILEDLTSLFNTCFNSKLTPLYLRVGYSFLDIACTQAVISQFKIVDWEYNLDKNYKYIAEIYSSIKMAALNKCCKNNGQVFSDNEVHPLFKDMHKLVTNVEVLNAAGPLDIYFDSEEEYMSLYAINTFRKAIGEELSIDGHPIEVLYYKEGSFLTEFDGFLVEH